MFTREQIQDAVARGWMDDFDLLAWDVCKALELGRTQSSIAEQFSIDERRVRYIRDKRCPECISPPGRRPKCG